MYTPTKTTPVINSLYKATPERFGLRLSPRTTHISSHPYFPKGPLFDGVFRPTETTKNLRTDDQNDCQLYKGQNFASPRCTDDDIFDFLLNNKPKTPDLSSFAPNYGFETRNGSSSEAFANAIKALQDQTKHLKEKVKSLENENNLLKTYHDNQLKERGKEEKYYQETIQSLQERVNMLENENGEFVMRRREIEEQNNALSHENNKLVNDKKKLKKKVVTLREKNKNYQQTIEDLEKVLQQTRESMLKNKATEDKIQEELQNTKKEKEGLEFKVQSLSEVVKKLEAELSSSKKTYSQQIHQLTMTNESLRIDNKEMRQQFKKEISEFETELSLIQESNAEKLNEYEINLTELRKANMKLAELLKIKNEEIENLKARNKSDFRVGAAIRQTTEKSILSARRDELPQDRERSEKNSSKLTVSATNISREELGNTISKEGQSNEDLYLKAKMLLKGNQGNELNNDVFRAGMSSNESSPERNEQRCLRVDTKPSYISRYSPIETSSTHNMSRNIESSNMNKSRYLSEMKYPLHEEDSYIARARTPVETRNSRREREKEKESSFSSDGTDNNSALINPHSSNLRSKFAKKLQEKAQVITQVTKRESRETRDLSPNEEKTHRKEGMPKSVLRSREQSEERRKMLRLTPVTFDVKETNLQGIHQLFSSPSTLESENKIKEASDKWRGRDNTARRVARQEKFCDILQGNSQTN